MIRRIRSRYDYDVRQPTRRKEVQMTGCGVVVVVVLMVGALVGFCLALAYEVNKEATAKPKQTHDSMTVTDTYNGEKIRYYVMIDPDTGLQYVVNDRGGMCPRYNRDGEQMGATKDE